MARVDDVDRTEGVEVQYCAPTQLQDELAKLAEPWIADEGPTDCGFRQGLAAGALRHRGLAFDDETTVTWDEDVVQIIRRTGPIAGVVPLRSEVLVRSRPGWPRRLNRIDYLRSGALIASRYTCPQGKDRADDA